MTGPEHCREAEWLLDRAHHWTYGDGSDPAVGLALATEAQAHATLALAAVTAGQHDVTAEPADAFVYRAARGPFTLGTYATQDPAREHCEADAINTTPELYGGIFDWLGDECAPDDPYELVVAVSGVERITDYTVTRITVDTEYDSEADS